MLQNFPADKVLHQSGLSIGGYARNNTSALTRNASDNAFTAAKNRYFRVAPLWVGVKGKKIMLLWDGDEEGPDELIAGLLRREGIQMVDSTLGSNRGDVCN